MSVNLELSSDHRTGKKSVFIQIPKKGHAKDCSNYCTIALTEKKKKKKNWKILKKMVVPDHFTCLLRNLYTG